MSKLSAEKIDLTRDVVEQILQSYRITDFTFKPFTQGIANTTVGITSNGRQYVLRIYALNRKTDDQILFELDFQNYLRRNGVPIPNVCTTIAGDKLTIVHANKKRWQVVLFEFVEGRSKTRNHTLRLTKELALLQARMHVLGRQFPVANTIDMSRWGVLQDYYACYLTDTSNYSVDIGDFISKAKRFSYEFQQPLPYSYNHLDLDLDGNVIVNSGRIQAVIDFDDLAYSPSVVCLGYSLWNVLHDAGLIRAKQYLAHYEQVRPLSEYERQVLPDVVRFRNYEIGALRLFRTGNIACMERPMQIEATIQDGLL